MARSAAFFAAPFTLPVSSATRMPSGASRRSSVSACCAAKISVGAMSTALVAALRGRVNARRRHQRFSAAHVAL